MNVFGIGNLELILILLVALLVLGPGRMVDAARTVGKFWAEAQRTLRAVTDAVTVKLDEPPQASPQEAAPAPEGTAARRSEGVSARRSEGVSEGMDETGDAEAEVPKEGGEPEGPRG